MRFFIPLLIILVFSRFWLLDKLPVSLTHDEMVYAIQAKSLALTGKDTFAKTGFFSLQPVHPMYAEWPATIMAPAFWITNNPLLATHLITAVMGVLLPLGFAYLIWGLWQKKDLAYIALVMASFNPLLFQFSRLAYDAVFSVFFYIWGAAILVNAHKQWKLLSLLFLVTGFFQYQGMKLLLLPWVVMIVLIDWFSHKQITAVTQLPSFIWQKIRSWSGLIVLVSLLITLGYAIFLLPHQDTAGRLSKTVFTDSAFVSPQVDTERRLSLPFGFTSLFSNKLTLIFQFMSKHLLAAFSPMLLFLEGEANASGFAVWSHGLFYLVDILLLAIGVIYLFHTKKTRIPALLLILLTLGLSIPAMINTMSEWYLLRMMLAYTSLLFFIVWGFWLVWQYRLGKLILSIVLLVSTLNFGYQYFVRAPVYTADAAEVQEKVIARYIDLSLANNPEQKITVYTSEPDAHFAAYLLYGQHFTKDKLDEIRTAYQTKSFRLGQVFFTNQCMEITSTELMIGQIDASRCKPEKPDATYEQDKALFEKKALTIPAVLDSGEMYRIYNDQLCQPYQLSAFFHAASLDTFDTAKQTAPQLCQNWITDLRKF